MQNAPQNGGFSPRELGLAALMIVPLAVVFTTVPPVPQDPAYHMLADTRTCLGIPNFGNVVSNIAFLIVGLMGLVLVMRGNVEGATRSWAMFFFGVALVALGSGYYHWNPNNETLAWDRLPMTIAYAALFAAIVAEYVRPDVERTLLRAAVIIGIGSVVLWRYTDDLRLYGWVSFAPLASIVYIVIAYRGRHTGRTYLIWGLVFAALSRVAELTDLRIYELTGHAFSGHTLKHVLAAMSPYCVYLMLKRRRAVQP